MHFLLKKNFFSVIDDVWCKERKERKEQKTKW